MNRGRACGGWLAWGIVLLLAPEMVRQVTAAGGWGHDSWQMGDWLISYDGGFVRRGLAGSALRWLSGATGWGANHLAVGTSLACWAGLCGWLLIRGSSYFPAALVVSGVVMGFPVLQEGVVRKDCLLVLAMVACVELQRRPLPAALRVAGLNLAGGAAVLVHEAFLFFALPALVVAGADGWRTLLRRGVAWLPTAACGVAVILCHGSPGVARAIHLAWMPLWEEVAGGPVPAEPAAAIAAVGWSAGEGMALVKPVWATPYQPLAWAMVAGVCALLVAGLTRPAERARCLGWLGFQALAVAPLFAVGIDYGRWLFFWVAGTLVLVAGGLDLPRGVEERFRRGIEARVPARVWEGLAGHPWVLLVFGIPVLWSIEIFLVAGPLPRAVSTWLGGWAF